MSFAIENALFQWEEGERRVRESPQLGRQVERVVEDLRRRLGSTFTLDELAQLHGKDLGWAIDAAGQGPDATWVVHAAFARYAREAADFGGGRHIGTAARHR